MMPDAPKDSIVHTEPDDLPCIDFPDINARVDLGKIGFCEATLTRTDRTRQDVGATLKGHEKNILREYAEIAATRLVEELNKISTTSVEPNDCRLVLNHRFIEDTANAFKCVLQVRRDTAYGYWAVRLAKNPDMTINQDARLYIEDVTVFFKTQPPSDLN